MKSLKSSGKQKKPNFLVVRRVIGDSMSPALQPDRVVVGVGRFGRLRVGDIVIIWHEGLEKIKRISQLRDDEVYVVGDNLAHSTDSRSFGWLPVSVVRARVLWPRRLAYAKNN